MYYREIQFDESDYEDGAKPGELIITFDDLDEDEGDVRFDHKRYRKEVPPQETY